MANRSTTYITVAAVTIAAGLAAYAVYFDYKRRNDVEFRKKLKKKRVQKVVAQTKETEQAEATSDITPDSLREVLKSVRTEAGPQSPEEKETYFMTQVGIGEQFAAQGPKFYLPAATAFFRALRVYPAPVELIVIYEKTIIEPVFKIIMDLTQLDVKYRIEAYYDFFPPKKTGVSVVTRELTSGQGHRQLLVVNKDVAAGEVIYKEFPVVTALDPDLQAKGTHCGHCLRPIQPEMSLQMPKDSTPSPFHLTYCSKACMLASKKQTHSLLFTLENPLPAEIPSAPPTAAAQETRREAQAKFAEYVKKENRATPLLVARFIARQVAGETQKLVQAAVPGAGTTPENDFTDADNEVEKYVLADHLERLRYLEVVPNKEETALLTKVLATALPGLEEFITEEKYATMAGKIAYNSFGVCFGGGRDDRPTPAARPEELEKTRTPYGTNRQVGSALYTVSSYLTHSCKPSARPSFSSGTSEISIIANHDLKKGDVLTVAFVDVTQHPGETTMEARRRRRFELARGWRFSCACERCEEEAQSLSSEEKASATEQQKDESKVEDSVKNYPAGQAPQASADVE
ncbi:hypothetical protein GALMADRAFT_695672 [Galerina marginata CBS 339.88]|uniref:Uncharacterized protein n=1 Tax=Galerina marginata (strain CBS 339.88) TaxID=685588 RepID=A0A067TP21_GALM3|nr:hypothetical protein GALMADRAFT_695672 [Galerina marginata CBS 339.88]